VTSAAAHVGAEVRTVSPEVVAERSGSRASASLVLMRHAATRSGADTFLGWLDEPLSQAGLDEAQRAGVLLRERELEPRTVFTSELSRAVMTAEAVVAASAVTDVPVRKSWRLNERHYGALQGRAKSQVRAAVGHERYEEWRRSLHGLPPRDTTERHDAMVCTHRERGTVRDVPWAESFRMVRDRVVPYFEREVVAELLGGGTVLVVAHSAPARALVAHLDGTPSLQIPDLNVPRAMPMLYEYDAKLRLLGPGRYLEPELAAEAAQAVAREGHGPAPASGPRG